MKTLRVSAFITLLLCLASLAQAADRVTCYTMWDQRYLYAALEIQDPDLESSNTTHMSNPWEDDAVEIFIETDAKRAENRSPNSYQLSVSAGGGSSWLVGVDGKATPKKIFTYKFAKKIQGTLNNPYDTDMGYTVEVAIPWSEMGGPPKVGQIMGFNVLIRMKGENEGFVSYSPDVKAETDVQVPAKWSKIKFVDTPTVIAVQDGALVCRKVLNQAPLINGTLGPGEWIRDMRFIITKPAPVKASQQPAAMERISMAPYYYQYQADTRKESPTVGAMSEHPMGGIGPWFSSLSVQWHKDQLAEAQQAGIDVILPLFNGRNIEELSCLVQAMKEMKADGESFPLLGVLLDTSAIGTNVDLKTATGKLSLYGMIKEFFTRVPAEFRAAIQLPVEKGGRPACIVAVTGGSAVTAADDNTLSYCNLLFAQDFGGKLMWIGARDCLGIIMTMNGYTRFTSGVGIIRNMTNGLDIAAIGAGYDATAQADAVAPKISPRLDGETYKKDWAAISSPLPTWLMLNSWNGFNEGSAIAPTAEYGERYSFLTRINLLKFNGMRQYDAKFLSNDTPQTMIPGALYQVTLIVKNAGVKPWYPGAQGVYLAARWFKDGLMFADTSIRLPIQSNVLTGQSFEKTMGVRTVDQDGKPLPEGDYELRWEMVRANDEWFTAGGDSALTVPVKIGAVAKPGFTLVSSTMPAIVKSGAANDVKVRLRNDGPTSWKAGTKVAYRLGKTTGGSDAPAQVVGSSEAALPADVEPGKIVELGVMMSLADPAWAAKSASEYTVHWEVNDGTKWLTSNLRATEAVVLTSDDAGAKFLANDTPAAMTAGKSTPVNLTIRNLGTEIWKKGAAAVGYHWYFVDGGEAVWESKMTQLPADVKPGADVTVKASVVAPPYNGQYYLSCDALIGGKWASLSATSRGTGNSIMPVNVVNGKLFAVDLAKLFDADVISMDTNTKDGDMDGAGNTLPGEIMPPLNTEVKGGTLWPTGMWMPAANISAPQNRISFVYPSKTDGAKNAVVCKGQTIQVKTGRYSSVHLLVLPTEKVVNAEIGLVYTATKAVSPASFAPYTERTEGMAAAFMCGRAHAASGEMLDQKCWLTDCDVPLKQDADLVSITLPNNSALKVMAITLVKAN